MKHYTGLKFVAKYLSIPKYLLFRKVYFKSSVFIQHSIFAQAISRLQFAMATILYL